MPLNGDRRVLKRESNSSPTRTTVTLDRVTLTSAVTLGLVMAGHVSLETGVGGDGDFSGGLYGAVNLVDKMVGLCCIYCSTYIFSL